MATRSSSEFITAQQSGEVHARLAELEQTLRAIRQGEVDALVVSTSEGDRVFTLQGADHPYRVMVETINEGAATLTPDGLVLYANRRFAEMVGMPLEKLMGSRLHDMVQPLECPALDELLARAQFAPQKEECNLLVAGGKTLPAYLSLSPLQGSDFQGICLIATDLTEQKERQEELAKANELLRAEVAERGRMESALRQLTGRLLNLQDEERRRVARDLHDSTAQVLSILTLNIASVQRQMDVPADGSVPRLLAESLALAEQACSEVRNLSHLLHPPNLDQNGLVGAIQWHCERVSAVTGIEISLDLDADLGRLPIDIETALFRVFQESLENVRRHSRSRVAAVRLIRKKGEVTLEVADQGQGIALGQLTGADHVPGVGVAGMRERLLQLGGQLEIESGDHGTTVRATAPVAKSGREDGSPTDSTSSDGTECEPLIFISGGS